MKHLISSLSLVLTLAMVAPSWADSLKLVRTDAGPLLVTLERAGAVTRLELDPAQPDWNAVESAMEGMVERDDWLSLMQSVSEGEGNLSLSLHSQGSHRVEIVTLPALGPEFEVEMEALQARLAEEGVRIQQHAIAIAEAVTQQGEWHALSAAEHQSQTIAQLIEHSDLTEEQIEQLQTQLADKAPVEPPR
ncbi:hypothetical protein [Ferrimonas marina]|uniref:Uncharacterized protein n=1 Tax=Ferrimonas marina TaxID=299255 RepID=A0A1M5RQT6_9GAMM|nr:hypothetical protein [Ferrimonas marina]SHH28540.1 hypothetical protein SAMN02745129_1710 [Ferrimonas marina]